MAYSSWSVVFGEQPSAAKWNILGSNDAEFNSMIVHSSGGFTTLNDLRFQNDNANSINNTTEDNVTFQHGWNQRIGDGTNHMSDSITFPTAFTTILWVAAGPIGSKATSAAATITAFNQEVGDAWTIQTISPATTGFTLDWKRAANTFTNTNYYGSWWMAAGTLT